MISAQSRRLLLNGNKKFGLLVLLAIIFSCSAGKKSVRQSDIQIVKADTPEVNTKAQVGSPPNNKTGKSDKTQTDSRPVNQDRKTIKIDTMIWKDISSSNKPVISKKKPVIIFKDGLELKDEYHIKLLVPLNSDETSNPEQSRFVHFYAGVLMALELLDSEGIRLKVKVVDTEEGKFNVKEQVSDLLSESTDIIIGPFERDDVKFLAEECKFKQIPLISPWQTSTKITVENPYYIQMKPNLREHFNKIAENTIGWYKKGEVAIIGKNNKETASWIKYFQDIAETRTGTKEFYTTYFVSTDSLRLGPTAFSRLLRNQKPKAIIIPAYSYNDEDFIYSCLRRLVAERGNLQLSVIGMPILYESDKIEFEYYNTLQMKVVMSDFVDIDQGKIREFRRTFLDMYGEIPTVDAVKGYDLMLFIGRNIWKYGKNFQSYLENETSVYLQSIYNIKKAKSEDSPVANDPEKFDYYENKHLDMIEFRGSKWGIKY